MARYSIPYPPLVQFPTISILHGSSSPHLKKLNICIIVSLQLILGTYMTRRKNLQIFIVAFEG